MLTRTHLWAFLLACVPGRDAGAGAQPIGSRSTPIWISRPSPARSSRPTARRSSTRAAGSTRSTTRAKSSRVDHERRRQQEPLPRRGRQRALVADRRSHRVHGAPASRGLADLRALDGCGRVRHADHPRRQGADQHRLVARRHADRVHDAGRRQAVVADQDAQGAGRREVDGDAAHCRAAELPARRPGLRRGR